MLVKDIPVGAIHAFQVRTLRSMGYRTRVALSNKSHVRPDVRTDYRVDATVFASGRVTAIENVAALAADSRVVIDCAQFHDREPDATIVFHLIPSRFVGKSTAEIARDEMMFLASIQDHYVEYYREDGCSAGVLYQTGPFNHPKLSPKSTTLIQAPKFYVSSVVDSKLSLLNACADASYARVAKVRCTLVGSGIRTSWVETVEPFVPMLISVRDKVRSLGVMLGTEPVFVCLYAVCENATVIPLTIQCNDETGAIGLEHSLPPDYYADTIKGPARMRTLDRLLHSRLFEVSP